MKRLPRGIQINRLINDIICDFVVQQPSAVALQDKRLTVKSQMLFFLMLCGLKPVSDIIILYMCCELGAKAA